MKLGTLFHAKNRKEWRAWLKKNHATTQEIWLVHHKKHTGRPHVSYSDSVEEALCFGWIDSTAKSVNTDTYAQRFTPRKDVGNWSELNKERVRRLIAAGKMTAAGMAKVGETHHRSLREPKLHIPAKILKELKKDPAIWKNFQKFPETYKIIRIGWIAATKRSATYTQRLQYFLKMTKQNKRYGMLE
jgi:uncharacterized protein YdeI (YjbR/CyaY-like superfamily)